VLQIDSLPEQGQHVADAGANSTDLPEILAADHDRLAEHGGDHSSPHRVRRPPKRGASKNGHEEVPVAATEKLGKPGAVVTAPASKAPPVPAVAPAPPPPAAEPGVPAPKPDCEPPWYFDAKGIQRAKPVCL
jgi:hypothetical protein